VSQDKPSSLDQPGDASQGSTKDQSFVGRWSRRKLRHQAGETSAQPGDTKTVDAASTVTIAPEHLDDPIHALATGDPREHDQAADQTPLSNGSAIAEQSAADEDVPDTQEEPLLTDADMPDIGTLNATSDISPFFNRGVSVALRKAALRTVFSLPVYNIRDGLNDYDEDYTVWEPLGDTVTCDMKYHEERRERERLERERLEAEAEAEAEAEDRI